MGIKDVLLNEKVSKREIDEALRNPNVLIGAEFEFKIPQFEKKYAEEIKQFEKLELMQDDFVQYDDALELYEEDPDNNPLPKLPDWAIEQGYEEGEEIPSPDELFPGLNRSVQQNTKKSFDRLVKEFLPKEKLPFKDMIASDSYETKSSTKWVIKPDGSLGMSGVEIVSPVMSIKEFLVMCPKMFEFIGNMGYTTGEDCGFHISISLKDIKSLGKSLDVTKLSLFTDEGYIYNFFKTREFNTYAKSAHDEIFKKMVDEREIERMIDEEEITKEYSSSHYMAINIEHLNTKNEYIEFRYIGAANYHQKWDRIKSIIGNYIYDLSLACDPEFKKKEYEHKLARLLNKIQLFVTVVEMTKMVNDKTLDKTSSSVRKEWSNLWQSWNALKMYKEAVDKDKDLKSARKGFLRMCDILGIRESDIIWDYKNMKFLK